MFYNPVCFEMMWKIFSKTFSTKLLTQLRVFLNILQTEVIARRKYYLSEEILFYSLLSV